MPRHDETLEQTCTRLSQQSIINQNQAQYLSEMSLLLCDQSQAIRERSRDLRERMANLAAALDDWLGRSSAPAQTS